MEIKFSILMLIKTKDELKDIIEKFKKNKSFKQLEIVLIDTIGNDDAKNIAQNSDKFVYVDAIGMTNSKAYNTALKIATGNYISFIDEHMEYTDNAIKSIQKSITKEDAKILCLRPKHLQDNIMKSYKICPENGGKFDLVFDPYNLNLMLESYFINAKLLKKLKMDEDIFFEDAKIKFLLQVLMRYPIYYLINDQFLFYYIAKEDNTSTNFMQYSKEWYNDSLTKFIIPFMKELKEKNVEIPLFVQEAMMYCIFAKYNCNLNDRNKMILSKEEALQFFDNTAEALKYISTKFVLNEEKKALFKMRRWLKYQFVLIKNKKKKNSVEIEFKDNYIYLNENGNKKKSYVINPIDLEHVNIYAINYCKDTLKIDFTVGVQDFIDKENFKSYVKYKNNKIDAKESNCYPLLKTFGLTVSRKEFFQVEIPVDDLKQNEKIEFYFNYKGNDYKLITCFEKVQAHLNNSKYSYWSFNSKYYLCNKREYLNIERKRIFSGCVKEIKYFIARMLKAKRKSFTFRYFGLRMIYWCVRPFYKNKQVWLTFDKLYKAGDNGEYIYQYIRKNHPDINIYYVIKKDSLDYPRLKNEKDSHILVYGTFKHKLMALLSTAILDTHANAVSYCSFDTKRARNCICDLFNPEIICIQHGLTIQKIAQYQNRLFDNIKLYCCASKYEVSNLLDNPMYSFEKEQIKLTGLARYDGLKSNEQRQILITPTWRRNIVNSNVAHIKKSHNNFFKNSKYYKIYNTLINDEKLIQTAKENNYKIIYLLHPAISAQKEDYEKNDFVELIAATDNMNYEKILTESSLMVTDYSGVQFDFAYMRKPIVYYHPDELPPHYDAGGLDYKTMGFGPICKNNDEIVETLCDYMKNNCVTKEEYVKRANDFFEFDDHNNCERIYNTIINYMKEVK